MFFIKNKAQAAMEGSRILDNELKNNYHGIYVGDATKFIIEGNTITESKTLGIYLGFVHHGIITQNTISNSGLITSPYKAGIGLSYTNRNNTISENTLTNNQPYNIWVRSPVSDAKNMIWKNNIYKTNIYDENEAYNLYCVDGVGNNYYDGAIGPECA